MGSVLFNIIIEPLILIEQFVFVFVYRLFHNSGLAIIGISFAVNLLTLPLYKRADEVQENERKKQFEMSRWVEHIKKTFKGDERYMILSEYYRQQNYKPFYSVLGSVSLFLQIPFFMAAYSYLSGLEFLNGKSFLGGIIADLGKPDAMLVFGTVTINVLPILMTVINLISGYIYTRGEMSTLRDKLQILVLALLFVVLLYNSPSGLVLYWTMNNTLSLVKNVFSKLIKEDKTKAGLISAFGLVISVGLAVFFKFKGKLGPKALISVGVICILFQIPLCLYFIKKKKTLRKVDMIKIIPGWDAKMRNRIFILSCIFMSVLMGALIPSALISSSAAEFVNMNNFYDPVNYIYGSLEIYSGFFLLWLPVVYLLSKDEARTIWTFVMSFLSLDCLINYMFFGRDLGTLSADMKFEKAPSYSVTSCILSCLCIVILFFFCFFIARSGKKVFLYLFPAIIISLCILSSKNIVSVNAQINEIDIIEDTSQKSQSIIPLSKNGKNVIVLMLDRAISGYLPYIFAEKPELEKQFSGFTYYPNTISFGRFTIYGSGGLFGGYEYTPDAMNRRSDELLVDKHDQALKLMPVIFSEHGYSATVCDPPFAGYEWIPDISIYDDYPDINAYITYGNFFNVESTESRSDYINGYIIFKAAPVIFQKFLYDDGFYIKSPEKTVENNTFLKAYNVVSNFPYMTEILDDDSNNFFMMNSVVTHEVTVLQLPDYVPQKKVDNSDYDIEHVVDGKELPFPDELSVEHYHVNMAAFIQLGKWFDYLRECGVYDNTRIILVADHGYGLGQFEDLIINDELDAQWFNPLFMVKDFNETGFETSHEFMTNADTPTLAMKDLIEDPINPFTGNPVNNDEKTAHDQILTFSSANNTSKELSVYDTADFNWYSVHDDIFNKDNWELYDYH